MLSIANRPAVNPWLMNRPAAPHARVRLFCFPYAGGSALIYRRWQESLPPIVEVCPVQLPGRGNRSQEPPYKQLVPLAEAATRAMIPHLDLPFAFFGHSMGATLAFEIARLLRRAVGVEPFHLFVSGRRAPQVPNTEPPIHDLPEPELLRELRQLNGTPKEVLEHPELMEMMLPLLRADFSVAETYTFVEESPLSCPFTAFGGLQDAHVEREHLEAWREHTTGPFMLRMLPGDHFFLNTSHPHLIRAVSQTLHRAAQQSR